MNVAGIESCESSAAPIARYDYGYDDRGNRLSETYTAQALSLPEHTAYAYDKADRLTGVSYQDGGSAKLYELGGDGTRRAEKEVSPFAGDLRTTGFNGVAAPAQTYGYDDRGGLTSITDPSGNVVVSYQVDYAGRVHAEVRGADSKTFTWDVSGRLAEAKVTKAVAGGGASVVSLAYRYDHGGRRIEKQGPAGTTRYVWGEGDLVEEQLPGGTKLVYERAGLVVSGIRAYGAGGGTAGTERLMHDGQESVVGRVRSDATVAMYRYDAWGRSAGRRRRRARTRA